MWREIIYTLPPACASFYILPKYLPDYVINYPIAMILLLWFTFVICFSVWVLFLSIIKNYMSYRFWKYEVFYMRYPNPPIATGIATTYAMQHWQQCQCFVCLANWGRDELLNILPCNHLVHTDCIRQYEQIIEFPGPGIAAPPHLNCPLCGVMGPLPYWPQQTRILNLQNITPQFIDFQQAHLRLLRSGGSFDIDPDFVQYYPKPSRVYSNSGDSFIEGTENRFDVEILEGNEMEEGNPSSRNQSGILYGTNEAIHGSN